MRRYRKGEIFRPPSAAESAAHADALEGFRRRPPVSQDLAPVGQDIIVKTPEAGIDARDEMTISSAVCTRCIEIDGTSGTKTLVETDEELRIYNFDTGDVAPDIFVRTALSSSGTRYVGLDDGGIHEGKLDANLDYDDTTGVTVSVWKGSPQADTGDNIENVLPLMVMTSGTLDSGSPVVIQRIDGEWRVTHAEC